MHDHHEVEALKRIRRRLRMAIVDHRQHNDGEKPTELKVAPNSYLLLRSHELVDDDQYCAELGVHIRIA